MKKFMLLKTVLLLLAVIMTAGLFAGCGNKVNDKDEQGRTIVSVGNWPSTPGKSLDNLNAIKASFEAANPDVVIDPDEYTFERKIFYAKAEGGQLPTLYETAYTEVPEIINSEYSADLTKVLKERGYDGMFNENILDIVTKDGKIMAFPKNAYVFGLGCNMDLMKQAGLVEEDGTPKQPKDWYEAAKMAKVIKEKTGKAGFVLPTSDNCGGWMFMPIAWSFGVDFMEQGDDGKWTATFNTPEMVEALEFIKALKWEYDVFPANSLIGATDYYKTLGTDGAGLYIVPGDYSGNVLQYGMVPDKIGVMAMPAGPKRHVTLLGGAVYCISNVATEDQIEAAIRWIEVNYNYKATDAFKDTIQKRYDSCISKNQLVGVKPMSPWSEKSEGLAYEREMIDKMSNSNPNHVRLYNDFVANCPAEIQLEEPVCCQELYQILDGMVQEVLTNENADCGKLIEKGVSDFQTNYLDNLEY